MVSQQPKQFADCQRIQVAKEVQGTEKILKICVERHDETLGWYTAGALTLPIHQLPLLQQALDDLDCAECPENECRGKIISFPLLEKSAANVVEM